jgi:hypothetical protein
MAAWSTANCCEVTTFLVSDPEAPDVLDDDPPLVLGEAVPWCELEEAVPLELVGAVVEVVAPVVVPPVAPVVVPPVVPDLPGLPGLPVPIPDVAPEPAEDSRAEVRALSSLSTFLMSAETAAWAADA